MFLKSKKPLRRNPAAGYLTANTVGRRVPPEKLKEESVFKKKSLFSGGSGNPKHNVFYETYIFFFKKKSASKCMILPKRIPLQIHKLF